MTVANGVKHSERAVAVSATVILHAVLLAVLLTMRPFITAPPDDDTIAVFDIVTPPPEVVSIPPPPPEQPLPAQVRAKDTPAPAPAPAAKALVADRPGAAAPQPADFTPAIALPAPAPLPSFADATGTTGTAVGTGAGGGDGGNGSGGTGAGGIGSGEAKYLNADWIRKPTAREWAAIWPRRAMQAKRSGQVILMCLVRSNGRPKRCKIDSENPKGLGFGNAAIALSINFVLRPVTLDEEPVDIPIRVPLEFAFDATKAKTATPAQP